MNASPLNQIPVALELGPKRRVFAHARGWIGWCRSGKDEAAALAALASYAPRYARVAERAGLAFSLPGSAADFTIADRINGNATTDFGALGVPIPSDLDPLDNALAERLARLLGACWVTFDDALALVPAEQRDARPTRGRSPAAMRLHVVEADLLHLSAFGHAADPANIADQEAATRARMLGGLRATPTGHAFTPQRRYGFAWTPSFAARRSAWHALDHAWQIEDQRS